MRMLVDTENWQRVITFLEDGDDETGLLRLIEKRSGYLFAKKARDEFTMNPIYTRRVFPAFHIDGNPFNAENSSGWLSLEKGIRFQYETQPVAVKKHRADASDGNTEHDNQEAPIVAGDDEPEIVLNSSTLAGYIRYGLLVVAISVVMLTCVDVSSLLCSVVSRFCGVYLKMMEHLPTIAWDIMLMLNRIFEFYAYAVFTSFTDRDAVIQLLHGRSDNGSNLLQWDGLKHNICRIADEMLAGETFLQTSVALHTKPLASGNKSSGIQHKPGQQPIAPSVEKTVTLRRITRVPVALEDANERNLYALAERCIACEVVCTQVRLLKAIEATARSYLPDRYHCLMEEVYTRNKVLANQLRGFTYRSIATKLVDAPRLLHAISQIEWDITYISEHHNDYIVHLVQKCGEAWGGLQILADGSIPVDAREEIWAAMVQSIMETLLNGFSSVTKCTPQGRALMSMDLHALQNGLDLINHISSAAVPRGREHVNNYVKAFYYDDAADVLAWIKENKVRVFRFVWRFTMWVVGNWC